MFGDETQAFNYKLTNETVPTKKTRQTYDCKNEKLQEFHKKNPQYDPNTLNIVWVKDYFKFLHDSGVTGKSLWQYHSALSKLYEQEQNKAIKDMEDYNALKNYIKTLDKNDSCDVGGAEDMIHWPFS